MLRPLIGSLVAACLPPLILHRSAERGVVFSSPSPAAEEKHGWPTFEGYHLLEEKLNNTFFVTNTCRDTQLHNKSSHIESRLTGADQRWNWNSYQLFSYLLSLLRHLLPALFTPVFPCRPSSMALLFHAARLSRPRQVSQWAECQ